MAKNLMSVFGAAQNGKAAGTADSLAGAAAEGSTASAGSQGITNALPVMVLGKTLTFKGELSADEDLMLFGRVEGAILHTASLTVAVGGVVVGDIRAKTITIKGTVEGDLEATESITISPSANVIGDIAAPRVCIIEGAQFNGSVEMTEAPAAELKAAAPAGTETTTLNDKAVETILSEP